MKTPIAADDIRKGDLIRKEYDPPLMEAQTPTRVTTANEYRAVEDGDNYNLALGSLFLLEGALILPTRPGVYVDSEGDIWRLSPTPIGPQWSLWGDQTSYKGFVDVFAPFTLLVPVAEVATAALEAVNDAAAHIGFHVEIKELLPEIAARFGVTL